MKLLFDQNPSHKLVERLSGIFPGSVHVRDIGMKAAGDPIVWEYARQNDLMIVSKDSDFHQRSFLYGFPPKVIWVKLGNCRTMDVEQLSRKNNRVIKDFFTDQNASFISLS